LDQCPKHCGSPYPWASSDLKKTQIDKELEYVMALPTATFEEIKGVVARLIKDWKVYSDEIVKMREEESS
jgi:hypothetical protein